MGGLQRSLKLRYGKIADTDEADLADVHELLHGGNGLLDGHLFTRHMKLVQIDPVGA